MIVLSKRLRRIADLCDDCDILIDVGCDHAMIPVSLIKNDRIGFAIATDINAGPIEAAKRNAKSEGVSEKMRFIVADGLMGLLPADPLFDGRKVTLLISGMGGPLMEKIIREGDSILPMIDSFVFSPHSKIPDFRRFLGENGFCIRYEKLIKEDGKYYFVILCKRGENSCKDETDYELGPGFFDEKCDEKPEYLKNKLHTYEKLCRTPGIDAERVRILEDKRLLYERSVRKYDML